MNRIKSLIKENSNLIIRLFVTHIGMIIFGTVLATASASYDNILMFVSLFSICFYMALLYVSAWEQGSKDVIRADAGRIPHRPCLGFLLGAVASSVGFLLVFLMLIGYFFGYAPLHSDFGMGLYGVCRVIIAFWQAPYLGLAGTFFSTGTVYTVFGAVVTSECYYLVNMLFYFLTTLPAVAFSGIGYLFGYKNFRIFSPMSRNTKK